MTDTEGELRRSVDRLSGAIEQLRSELVRKDVYDADEQRRTVAFQGLEDDVADIKNGLAKQEERRASDRRLIIATFVAPVLLLLFQIYIASQIGAGR